MALNNEGKCTTTLYLNLEVLPLSLSRDADILGIADKLREVSKNNISETFLHSLLRDESIECDTTMDT
jgi:hypothetical protein